MELFRSISYPLFLSEASRGKQEISKDLTVSNNHWWLFWLHIKTGPSKVGDVITPPGIWPTPEFFPVGAVSRTRFKNLPWGILVTCWDFSIRRNGFYNQVLTQEERDASIDTRFWRIWVNNVEVVNNTSIKLDDFFYFTFILLSCEFQLLLSLVKKI